MGFRPRSNVRRKQRLAAESDGDDDIDITKHIAKSKAKPVQAPPSARAPTKLSFGDDDESEIVFKKKKKKKPKARGVSTADLDGTEAQAAGSSYSAATLADLKDQTPQMPAKFTDGAARVKDGAAPLSVARACACVIIPAPQQGCFCRPSRVQDVWLVPRESYLGLS